MDTESIKTIKSDILKVRYQGKIIRINITKELSINESIINSQLKDSPSSYAFLCMLKNKYIKERDKLDREKEIAYSEAWLYYKSSDSKMNNDTANHKANTNKKYISIYNKWQKISNIAENLISICRAYENRENILRTISANLRKENQ
jgi:hypothetical protein|nr:MAG TPA: recombination, repair and ssDNA binding protein [Caudoviricetes sp.]